MADQDLDHESICESGAALGRFDLQKVEKLCSRLLGLPRQSQDLLLRNSSQVRRPEVSERLVAMSHALRHSDPRQMLAVAELASRVASMVRLPPGREPMAADGRAWALLSLANALRVNGKLRAAEAAFQEAEAELASGSGLTALDARYRSLLGSLRAAQQRYPESIALYREAVLLYERGGEGQAAAEEKLKLGRALGHAGDLESAVRCLVSAIEGLEGGGEDHLPLAGAHNLAHFLGDSGYPSIAVHLLRQLSPLYGQRPGDAFGLRLRWLEGRLHAQLGCLEPAARALEAVRLGFTNLGLAYDAALAALELAAIYAHQGCLDRVQSLAVEMFPVFQSRDLRKEARLALLFFVGAAEARRITPAEVRSLAERVERSRQRG